MKPFILSMILVPALSAIGLSQDSGPGPASPETVHSYQVTMFNRRATADATFSFSTTVGDDENADTRTEGTFEGSLQDGTVTGTWNAIDVGGYAIWVARADGETHSCSAFGLSTPDVVIGRARVSSANPSRLAGLFQLFGIGGNTSFFYGTSVTTEMPNQQTDE